MFVASGNKYGVCPYLLAAICYRESQGGELLTPKGPAGTGDGGRGHGLMQVDVGSFASWLNLTDPDGVPLWQKPPDNVDKGAEILRGKIRFFKGDMWLGVAAYNAGEGNIAKAVHGIDGDTARRKAADARTAHGDYLSSVMFNRTKYLGG